MEIKNRNTGLNFRAEKREISYSVRAKYYISLDGVPRLACVQKFSDAKFRESGWEALDVSDAKAGEAQRASDDTAPSCSTRRTSDAALIARATRRAKITAFDFIMNNDALDLFATFTYAPESEGDKASYDECYKQLGVWLSNRVQRCGLKYVIVPERTERGDIHFHAIMNSDAVKLERAYSAKSGRALSHNGKPLYNITDWKWGFTSAEKIAAADGDRRAVAKYIFKYMGKQMGQKIGGRYVLTGGDLKRPFYVYSYDETEFFEAGEEVYCRQVDIEECNLHYSEWSFL